LGGAYGSHVSTGAATYYDQIEIHFSRCKLTSLL
jgi:hypothetical protein